MVMWEEPVLFDESRQGFLEYSPVQILSMKSQDGRQTYQEGEDFIVAGEDGVLMLTKQSRIPPLILTNGSGPNFERFSDLEGNRLLFAEGHLLHDHQIQVCYTHNYTKKGKPLQPVHYHAGYLSKAVHLLETEKTLRIAMLGDSISCGANASAITNTEPFREPYFRILASLLSNTFSADIHLENYSKGGETSAYAKHLLPSIISSDLDVLIVAFGMNDATTMVPPVAFRKNLLSVIEQVHKYKPLCEIVLVAGLLPNPIWSLSNLPYHYAYLEEMHRLSSISQQIQIVDCQTLSSTLYKRKRYSDFTGNNINHPNDYMHLQYAKLLFSLFR